MPAGLPTTRPRLKCACERAKGARIVPRYKATDVVDDHHEAIVRVAVALCYQGTLSGFQVAEIVERVEWAEHSAA